MFCGPLLVFSSYCIICPSITASDYFGIFKVFIVLWLFNVLYYRASQWVKQIASNLNGHIIWRIGRTFLVNSMDCIQMKTDWSMMLNATFNNISVISWRSVLLMEETGVPWENHRPVASHWQTLSHNVVSRIPRHKRVLNSQL